MAMVKSADILAISVGKVPMVKLLMPLMIGIFAGRYWLLKDIQVSWYLSVLCLSLVALVLLNRRKRTAVIKVLFFSFLTIFLFVFGYFVTIRKNPSMQKTYFTTAGSTTLVGEVIDEPVANDQTTRVSVDIRSAWKDTSFVEATGKVMLSIANHDKQRLELQYGDIIAFKNTLKEVSPPYNPHEFNYKSYLENKDIWFQGFIKSDQVELLTRESGNVIVAESLKLRRDLMERFRTYMHEDRAFQVAVALIFGYRSQIDAVTLRAFTNTGTIHVLSVSGLHVGLVFGLLTILLGWADRFRYGRQIRCLLIFLLVWCYVVLTGMAPSILRAGLMISFFLLSIGIGRKQVAINTLATSAFFILIIAPKSLFEIGFQLSYMAMLGIILLYPLFRQVYLPSNRYLCWVLEYAYVSIAAQLFTLPLVLYYFGQFPNYFLLSNLFIALPSTAIMYVGLCLAVLPVTLFGSVLGAILDFLITFMLAGLTWIESFPYAVISGIGWPMSLLMLSLGILTFLILTLNYRRKKFLLAYTGLLLIIGVVLQIQLIQRKNYQATKLYSLRNGFALARINKGTVVLYATYDSLSHPSLEYSVMPDLLKYGSRDNIRFLSIRNKKRQNVLLEIDGKKILLLEGRWTPSDGLLDGVILRKNSYAHLESFVGKLKKEGIIFLDGSSSDEYVEEKLTVLEGMGYGVYSLKNNFAYVWY